MFSKNPLLEFLYTFFLIIGATAVITCLFEGLLHGTWNPDWKLAFSLGVGVGIYSTLREWMGRS